MKCMLIVDYWLVRSYQYSKLCCKLHLFPNSIILYLQRNR